MANELTARQRLFIAEYVVDLNATQAAIRAGYSPKVANREGSRLLSHAVIAGLIAEAVAKRLEKAELTGVRVLEEMRRLAFSNVQSLFDAKGNLKPIKDLTVEESACIASIEVVIKNVAAGDGKTDTIYKVKTWDKTRVLEMLGRHFMLLKDTIVHEGSLAKVSDEDLERFAEAVLAKRKLLHG